MHPSWRNQEFHMDRSVPPPSPSTSSGNPVGDFSRKNTLMMSDQPSYSPAAVIGCGFARGPDDNLNGLCRNSIENGGFASNQPEEVLNLRYSNENGYHDQNNFVAPWQPNENNLHETSGNAVYTSSLEELQPFQWEQFSLAKVSTVLPPLQGHANQLKAYESSEIASKSHVVGQVQDFPRYGKSNSNFNASGDLPKLPSKQPLLVENLRSRSIDPRMYLVGVEGQVCSQESKSGAYGGLNSSSPSIDGRKFAEFHNEHVNDIFVQYQQIGSGYAGAISTSNAVKGDTEIEKTLLSVASGLIQSLKEEASTNKVETDLSIYGHDLENKEQTSSLKVDDNVASKASEKLWNGTLQLSSSIKLSAAGYFRSGNKMPDIYWSDSVEVKGKVRLEAFEKFIQDLPHSRNRTLMVMSLHLREGSSKDELQGMNEVIKKYKDGKRVGLARLSPGVDVYICPNSEMIITILAKNGFSKDSVAVQEKQDSLIGCVVWRKSTSADPGSRKLGNESLSRQPLSSSPNSNPQQVTGSDSSSAKPRAEAIQLAAAKPPVTCGVVGNNPGESKNAEPSAHPEVARSSSSPSPGAATNLHSSTVDGQAFPPSDLHVIHSIVKQMTDIEASIFQSLGIEKHPGNLQLLRTLLPSSSEVVKQPAPPTEDDDLPEYDFGAAVPHASRPNPLEANATKKMLNVEQFRPGNESVASSQRCVEAQRDPYGGPLPQRMEVEISSLPILHERAMKTTTQATGNINMMLGSKRKNLFDDDDMPEWNPSDMEHFKPLTDQTTRPPLAPNTFRPSYPGVGNVANPTSSHLPPLLPGPPSDGLHHPISVTAQVALPLQPPPPLPPQPLMRPPPFRPRHNTREPINHNRWSRR